MLTESYVPLKLVDEENYSEDKSDASSSQKSFSQDDFDISPNKNVYENLGYRDIKSNCGNYRFKLGIIDFLTLYNTSKYFENELKQKLHGVDKMEISAIDSKSY